MKSKTSNLKGKKIKVVKKIKDFFIIDEDLFKSGKDVIRPHQD